MDLTPENAGAFVTLWKNVGWPLLAIIFVGGSVAALWKHGFASFGFGTGHKARMELLEEHFNKCESELSELQAKQLQDAEDRGRMEAELAELKRKVGGLTKAFQKARLPK